MKRTANEEAHAVVSTVTQTRWEGSTPDELLDGIARTRAHMDERLSDLGRKLKPRVNLKRFKTPAAVLFAAITGLILFRAARPNRKGKAKAKLARLKVRSAGILDYLQALKLVSTVVRKGKPSIFIVEPGKS